MSWLLNILMPGAGVVWQGRPVVGLALAVVYAPALAVVLVAWLIAPLAVPAWLTVASAVTAGGAFTLAQLVLHQHLALRRDPAWRNHLATLHETANEQFDAGNYFEALLAVEELLEDDPEDIPAHLLRARIYAADGKYARARHAYQQLAKVDTLGQYRAEIRNALSRFDTDE